MHPEHHADRRVDRARQLQKRSSSRSDVTYTDASRHPHRSTMVAVALAPHHGWSTACSVIHSDDTTVAEKVAITLVMTDRATKAIACEKLTPLVTYTDILQHYGLGRLHYPPGHKDLLRRDAVLWRKLQTGVFPNPWPYGKVYPHFVTPHCRYCSQSATLIHMAWTCPQYADASHTEDTWESLLSTTDPAQQSRVISRALEAAASQGSPVDLL
ncbi:hypothetical protein HPB50_028771 [Hyalomma asiaticum]|nr:hypothetical protein HPB50_028771 [Hyalomma asiaticum]